MIDPLSYRRIIGEDTEGDGEVMESWGESLDEPAEFKLFTTGIDNVNGRLGLKLDYK